ncbi:uncharacterized protein LODBEIA_P59900 [Lodderomyces beijingensis]|uniref:GLC7-interacting protein 3 n=1 Tax=Lodderomyces beijingensis TaxID=1775926 RepID=A0ABP0ZW39_9ASCO
MPEANAPPLPNNRHLQQQQPPPPPNEPAVKIAATVTLPHQTVQGEEIDTGVSNGDVDWLFRGKSKKLVKKMTSSSIHPDGKEYKKSGESEANGKLEGGKHASQQRTESTAAQQSLPPPREGQTAKPQKPEPRPQPQPQAQPQARPQPQPQAQPQLQPTEKTSKLDRLMGRSRSSSASSVPGVGVGVDKCKSSKSSPQQPASPSRRNSSFTFMAPSVTSDLVYNDHDEARLKLRPPATTTTSGTPTTTTNTTPASSTTSSPSVSRSNSKKGLFSSLSSKFKSQSSAIPPAQPPKLNPNLIGAASNAKQQEDLIASTDRVPAGSGIPIRRRTSSNSSSLSKNIASSMFKDSFQDEPPPNSSSSIPTPTSTSTPTPPNDPLRFFRRKSSSVNTFPTGKPTVTTQNPPRVILNKNRNRVLLPLPELQDVKMKRVTFAIDKLDYDPQQQIPSRRPRKGNVMIPQDLNAPLPRLCLGIATTSNNKEGVLQQTAQYSEKEINSAFEAQKRALAEADKHQHEAHLQAKRIAMEVASFKTLKSNKLKDNGDIDVGTGTGTGAGAGVDVDEQEAEEEAEVDARISKKFATDASIDQPLHFHEQHFGEAKEQDGDKDNNLEEQNGISLETIYTRCCHLREILPIPATIKQLKNKTAPLEVLKMLNPKPTLIDVLSFSDFIAITPINTVIFDNVTMTTEMLKCFLVSLINNHALEKLSLRNVAIDHHGWKLLCAFLAENKTIKKLDISQQRVKAETSPDCIRGNLNWTLFIESLAYCGGIEELVINGCKLPDKVFQTLINKAVKVATRRLGVAAIEMNMAKAQMVAEYISDPESKCVGVDIAFNDLSRGQLRPFIDAFNTGSTNLLFLSLNATNLSNIKEARELLKSLIHVKSLRFLDLSSIPKLFPEIISSLAEFLPQFPNLRRIHLDLNELTSQSIGTIAMFLYKVPMLVHVSLLGNRNLNHSVAATIYSAVKQSKTLFALDIDYDLISDEMSQRIAFYLMRNMNNTMNSHYHMDSEAKDEDLMFDGSLLMETAEKLLSEIDQQDKSEQKENWKIQKIISDAMLERTRAIRGDIHKTIDVLFQKRTENKLSFDGKETLVRFCLLDSSLEKLVHMFEEHVQKFEGHPSHEGTPDVQIAPAQQETSHAQHSEVPDTLHHSSNELITAGPILSPRASHLQPLTSYFPSTAAAQETQNLLQPHQVVVESNEDGENVVIDRLTGRPVLMRTTSQGSFHNAKEQEIEEGEFHKLGFFMQLRNDPQQENKKGMLLNALPSGSELRDAIIAAKGIENVDDLIERINNSKIGIDKILPVDEPQAQQPSQSQSQSQSQPQQPPSQQQQQSQQPLVSESGGSSDTGSIESDPAPDQAPDPVVDKVYDKLLNDAERVRSNKGEAI